MCSFRKKTYPPKDQLTVVETWTVAQGEYGGKPLITRFNSGLTDLAAHPEYRYQIGIAIPLNTPREDGLPTSEEDQALSVIEDALADSLQQDKESLFAGVLSTGGMREFVFYTSNPEAARDRIKVLQEAFKSHTLHAMIRQDAEGTVFKQFT